MLGDQVNMEASVHEEWKAYLSYQSLLADAEI